MRDKQIVVRMSQAERAQLDKLAAQLHRNPSDTVRYVVREMAETLKALEKSGDKQ